MKEQMIPKELLTISKDLGMNSITFVKTNKEYGNIFSLSMNDNQGNPLPIGLPILYSVKGSIIKEIDTDDVLKILQTIKD